MRLRSRLAVLGMLLVLAACSGAESPPEGEPTTREARSTSPSTLPSPSTTSQTPTSQAPVPRIEVLIAGDVMLGRGVAAAHPDPTRTFRAMRPLLRDADLAVANLESTLSTAGPPTQGGDSFSAPPAVLRGLSEAGFDALSLANNHLGDHGDRALVETVRALEGSGIEPFGAGADLREAQRPAILRAGGVRVGLLGFNAIGETPEATRDSPGALSVSMPPRTGPLDRAELGRVLAGVRRLAETVDVVIVLPHWGTQYTHAPEPVQQRVGRRLVEAGADLVVGGHPHWVQRAERYRGTVIAHSLGNFVFDMDFMPQTMQGAVLTATIEGTEVVDVRFSAYRMDPDFTPRPLRGAAARAVLAPLGPLGRSTGQPGQ